MTFARSLFWKIFLIIWITNMLLLLAGMLMMRLEFNAKYKEFAQSARVRSITEYLIENYEAGVDTSRFRRPPRGSYIPQIIIEDRDTGLSVFGPANRLRNIDTDIYWDYISSNNGRYRIYVDEQLPEPELPELPWVLLGFALVINAGFSCFLTLIITRPILSLREHVENLGDSLSIPIEANLLGRNDEIGDLAHSIEQMSHRIRSLIESKQQLFFAVSHELRAPLARMQVAAQIVRERAETRGEDPKLYDRVDAEIESLNRLISELMSYIKEDFSLQTEEVTDLHALIETLVDDQDFSCSGQQIKSVYDRDSEALLMTKPLLLERALKNLLENAIKYSPADSIVEIHLRESETAFEFSVLDSGPGIPKERQQEVLQPFTRLHSESIEGVGLGLSIVARAVEEIGGTLELKNRHDKGLKASISLPRQ